MENKQVGYSFGKKIPVGKLSLLLSPLRKGSLTTKDWVDTECQNVYKPENSVLLVQN